MKLFSNLPNTLRVLFGTLRIVTVFVGIVWFIVMLVGPVIHRHFNDKPRLMITAGEVVFPRSKEPMALQANGALTKDLNLNALRGTLYVDMAGGEADLVSAARWAYIPPLMAGLIYTWYLLGLLRDICANIGRGEVFSERNLRLVRTIGFLLIVFSLVSGGLAVWADHVMGGYLRHHEVAAAIHSGLSASAELGVLRYDLKPALSSVSGNLVLGLLVLVMTEVFRQGLRLKDENDLTV